MKIGKYEIEKPIIQGGMGVGISWDQLAGNVSKEGGLGVISSVGTGYYKNKSENVHIVLRKDKPKDVMNFYFKFRRGRSPLTERSLTHSEPKHTGQ